MVRQGQAFVIWAVGLLLSTAAVLGALHVLFMVYQQASAVPELQKQQQLHEQQATIQQTLLAGMQQLQHTQQEQLGRQQTLLTGMYEQLDRLEKVGSAGC